MPGPETTKPGVSRASREVAGVRLDVKRRVATRRTSLGGATAGQTADVHSCSAGLDYPGVGPEHSFWKDSGRVEYVAATDDEALDAFRLIAEHEGIIPALETAHAVHATMQIARGMKPDQIVVINVSGRGDKDVNEAIRLLEARGDRV
jgi:tryptophan synthase beta subunit